MTNYIVLRQDTPDGIWHENGPPVESVSAEAAIRKAVGEVSGTYVAIPVRSFSPITVTVETKKVVKLA